MTTLGAYFDKYNIKSLSRRVGKDGIDRWMINGQIITFSPFRVGITIDPTLLNNDELYEVMLLLDKLAPLDELPSFVTLIRRSFGVIEGLSSRGIGDVFTKCFYPHLEDSPLGLTDPIDIPGYLVHDDEFEYNFHNELAGV